ncbi:hypothetical protein Rhe02_54820 [Rhizocola hellebori]|uniref:Uncharacterized protein n=1 Tax=Rhizocola hellebori TaxID=1392758 RepID=A0A8J3QD13_9ACTN|nr:hypothetical protein [Rhizocola hellebori]GIH07415.1 hypothetical protein Rhe02_54820 [Rhizocola hellebori]
MAETQNATRIAGSRLRPWQYAGAPSSGTSGTLAGYAEAGAVLWDTTNGVSFVNEGTRTSPYWTPTSFDQRALFGVWSDFRDQVGVALAATTDEVIVAGSGLRIFGQGIAETDSGLVVQAAGEGGCFGRMTTTDEDGHTMAIGMEAGVMQPDQHQLLVVDTEVSHVSAITLRAAFCGFVGLAADAFDPPVTGSTVTATLVQDDLAGLHFDVGYTAAARWYAVHNKSDAAASQTVNTGSRDTSVDVPAAGTFQRLRVEINATGGMTAFINKAQVFSLAAALDADEECSPVFCIESTSAAVKSVDVKRFATWAYR